MREEERVCENEEAGSVCVNGVRRGCVYAYVRDWDKGRKGSEEVCVSRGERLR